MRKYIIGTMVGFAIAFSVSAHAEVISMINKVVEGTFPVTVSGKKLNMDAVVIDGSTYLPVREFGESLGYDVKFDANLGVSLESKQAQAPTQAILSPGMPHPEIPPEGIVLPNGDRMFPTGEIRVDGTKDPSYIRNMKFAELQKKKNDLEKELDALGTPVWEHDHKKIYDLTVKDTDPDYVKAKKAFEDKKAELDNVRAQMDQILKESEAAQQK